MDYRTEDYLPDQSPKLSLQAQANAALQPNLMDPVVLQSRQPSARPDEIDSDVNSMRLSLQAGDLSVQLETKVAASLEIIELSSRLDMTTRMLRDTQEQLYLAMKRIGYLEGILHVSASMGGSSEDEQPTSSQISAVSP